MLYSVSLILLLTAIGVVFFRESLTAYEIVGLIMALGSLILLIRFAYAFGILAPQVQIAH